MKSLLRELYKEKEKLEKIVTKAERFLQSLGNVEDELVSVHLRKNTPQFYIKSKNPPNKYKYLPAKEKKNAIAIVQREYYERVYKLASAELKQINRIIKTINDSSWEKAYEVIGKGKRMVVDPIIETNEQYKAKWLEEEFVGKPFREEDTEIYSDRGERVRSKSEKIIADKLFRENIAYKYEYPLEIAPMRFVYPDFTILDEENRKTIIYEHFGLMDNPEYANNAAGKIQTYANLGFVLGDNFFMTMETSDKPFDSRMLDGIIMRIKASSYS
ncbi:MAG: hypothetical protein E7254_00320 [Lachnospiraceae bacterium]|nr:hypothetical protein [Lachnospiraceae bacterium]